MPSRKGVGVVIGRFQVPQLHEGHEEILRYAFGHEKTCVLIGIHPQILTRANPLDYHCRQGMITEYYASKHYGLTSNLTVLPLSDQPTDDLWSRTVDNLLRSVYPTDEITLYGGRDSFIPHYHGSIKTVPVDMLDVSAKGTSHREKISNIVVDNPDFRRGVIYATYSQRPKINLCVDIALTKSADGTEHVLLAQKAYEKYSWRFPGGFVDPGEDDAKAAAKRELREETGLTLESDLTLISCTRVPDWRDTDDSVIFSSFYHGQYSWGPAQGKDDIARVRWFDLQCVPSMTPGHTGLMDNLINYLRKQGKVV